jgi:ABC-type transport system involved in Fe-S cluster assembly fused permease/ATPase subunit
MEKLLDLYDERDGIQDAPGAKPLKINEGGGIVFDRVQFAYDSRIAAVHDISFTVPAGHTVALVGPSGSGRLREQGAARA